MPAEMTSDCSAVFENALEVSGRVPRLPAQLGRIRHLDRGGISRPSESCIARVFGGCLEGPPLATAAWSCSPRGTCLSVSPNSTDHKGTGFGRIAELDSSGVAMDGRDPTDSGR